MSSSRCIDGAGHHETHTEDAVTRERWDAGPLFISKGQVVEGLTEQFRKG